MEFNKGFNIFSKELPNEVVGFNFYSIGGEFINRFSVEEKGYPKANYKPIVNLNGKEIEMNMTESLYIKNDGGYLLIKDDGQYYSF